MKRHLLSVILVYITGVLAPGGLECQEKWMLEGVAGVSGSPAISERGAGASGEFSVLRILGHGTNAFGLEIGYLGAGSIESSGIARLDPFNPMPGDTLLIVESSDLGTRYLGLAYRAAPGLLGGRLSFRLGLGTAQTVNTFTADFSDLSGEPLFSSSSNISGWGGYGRAGIDFALFRLSRNLDLKVGGDVFLLMVGEGATAYLRGGLGLRLRL